MGRGGKGGGTEGERGEGEEGVGGEGVCNFGLKIEKRDLRPGGVERLGQVRQLRMEARRYVTGHNCQYALWEKPDRRREEERGKGRGREGEGEETMGGKKGRGRDREKQNMRQRGRDTNRIKPNRASENDAETEELDRQTQRERQIHRDGQTCEDRQKQN